jgi:hypothetical protein
MAAIQHEIETTDELKKLGFEKFSIPTVGKNLYVWYNGSPLISSFDKNDLAKTVKLLTKKLEEEYQIDERTVRIFTTYLVEEYLKLKEAELSERQAQVGGEQAPKCTIEKIKKLKEENSGISYEKWYEILSEKRNNIQLVAERNFPNSWPGVEFTLSVLKILNIYHSLITYYVIYAILTLLQV